MAEKTEKVVVPEMIKSLIMPSLTVKVPMPQGAAAPARSQAAPSAAPAVSENNNRDRS